MSISVIIPAYESAGYLPGCLESAQAPGVEIVLVDDGSSDGTADMVRSHYPDVRVFSQSNQGVSVARNEGVARASGTYVVFLDADDRLLPGSLPDLGISLEEREQDIVILRSFGSDGEHYPWAGTFEPGTICRKEDIIRAGYVRGSVCGCAFKKSYLIDNQLAFPRGIAMGEDLVFMSMALSAGGSVVFLDIPFYQIEQREGSASRRLTPSFLARYADGLAAAAGLVSDPALRTHTCLSMMLGITRVGKKLGYGPRKTFAEGRFDAVLPLSLEGVRKNRWAVRLMNRAYPLLFYAQILKDRLFR